MKRFSILFLLITNISFSQSNEMLEDLGHLINDALFFSNQYITPAADAAIYQSSSGWVNSAKKRPLWDVTLGVHANVFFVPNKDREFVINNSDFSFFSIENGTSATVPTALGNDNQVYLVGQLGDEEVRMKTPEGVNQEVVFYPHLSGAIALWYGTEFLVKFAPRTKLKKGDYQVYGFGLKHNLSQYLKSLQANKINLAGVVCYSNEDISFGFLDPQTSSGNLGINKITGFVDTWQFQINASKEYKKFEFLAGVIANTSDVEYRFTGEKGQIEEVVPLQSVLNEKLKEIYKTRTNIIGEVSARYQISNLYLQSTIAFGKFVNTNLSLQYEF
ncbi:DUF6588 family protein [Flavobacterium sp.]|uniref:DUF6588 family protein n=1 Tax=Flavobacterium sp. TaxID=239 RepID=UPI002B4AB230|nr:DUF6588 family protein [Flavobacterium sp.]HLF52980.1 DUF6588 family protein [Flavobacterium sp.]